MWGGLFQETLVYDIIRYVYVKLCTDFLLVGYNYEIIFFILTYSRLNKLSPRKRICAKQSHVRITWFLKHFEAF